LFANGGAGPSHAWVLSAELGLSSFIVPATATAVSAFGTGNSDLGFTTQAPTYARVPPGAVPSGEQLQKISAALYGTAEEVRKNLQRAAAKGDIRVERTLSIRFRGQTHHLDVPLERDVFDVPDFRAATARFERDYETLFGRGAAFAKAGYEILSVRASGTGALPPPLQRSRGEPLAFAGRRKVVFRDPAQPLDTAIFTTRFPASGSAVEGPGIIEFPGQSVVVPPGARARADEFGNLHVRTAP
jgi:N-methylhydantoinase A